MIELLDRNFFSFLRGLASRHEIKLLLTADHATPCALRSHTADAVPLLFYSGEQQANEARFTEKAARQGELGTIYGKDVLKLIYHG